MKENEVFAAIGAIMSADQFNQYHPKNKVIPKAEQPVEQKEKFLSAAQLKRERKLARNKKNVSKD